MGGISIISQRRKQQNAPASVTNNNQSELWFKDGDQALIKSVATGHPDDGGLTYIKVCNYRDGNTFKTEEIVLCFDNDVAGQRATTRATEMLSSSSLTSYINLPKEHKDVQDIKNSALLSEVIANRSFI